MARHRQQTTWSRSHARHRGPGSVERFVQRGRNSLVLAAASLVLVAGLVGWDPVTQPRY